MDIRSIVESHAPDDAFNRIQRLAKELASKGALEKLVLAETKLDDKGCKKLSHELLGTFKEASDSLKDMIVSVEGLLEWRNLLAEDANAPLSWLVNLSLKASEMVRLRHTMAKCFDTLTSTTLQYLRTTHNHIP